jgi:hypothetical protein
MWMTVNTRNAADIFTILQVAGSEEQVDNVHLRRRRHAGTFVPLRPTKAFLPFEPPLAAEVQSH